MRLAEMTVAVLQIAAERRELTKLQAFVEEAARDLGLETDALYDLLVALHDVVTNSIEHGYQGHPGAIEVELRVEGDALLALVRDQAPPFDPTQVPAPDPTVPLHERSPGGVGLQLVRHFVDDVHYRCLPGGGNELTLVKRGVLRSVASGGSRNGG
jgi:anti-sigma regulatory factor (Ser/Thr protein kinase)